jgi:hypothetical protein
MTKAAIKITASFHFRFTRPFMMGRKKQIKGEEDISKPFPLARVKI